jgi:AcrR family transcriptional regulator
MADSMSTVAGGGTLVQRNLDRTRTELLDAAVRLIEQGEEPTMRAVASEAGVGERTVYRYFENRDVLGEALEAHVMPRLGVPLCASVDELDDYIAELYGLFEQNRRLTVAMVASTWAQPDLARTRSRNLRALTELLAGAFPDADPAEVAAAAGTLRTVVSGAGWTYQRVSCGLPNGAVIANAQWLAGVVLQRLSEAGG